MYTTLPWKRCNSTTYQQSKYLLQVAHVNGSLSEYYYVYYFGPSNLPGEWMSYYFSTAETNLYYLVDILYFT